MSLTPATFERVRRLVHQRTAIVLDAGKEYLVESRLAPIARAHGIANVNELVQQLDKSPALMAEVVEAMTTNETSFFRDHHPFEALRRQVIPELLVRRAEKRALRIWCAACSTGQEPYSVAMMLDEHFPQLSGWNVSILATDVSRSVLARARSGRYRQIEVNRGLSAGLLVKYFMRDGLEWEIRPEIKRRVLFQELNLIGTWPPMEPFDVIFLRNVLIYFDQPTKLTILRSIHQQAAPDGYLVLGGSETTPHGVHTFERLPIARAGIYKRLPARPSQSSRAR